MSDYQSNQFPDWIVTLVTKNTDPRSEKTHPLLIYGVNLNKPRDKDADKVRIMADTTRHFYWRVTDLHDPRYDVGAAVIDDNVPLYLLPESRRGRMTRI